MPKFVNLMPAGGIDMLCLYKKLDYINLISGLISAFIKEETSIALGPFNLPKIN